MRDFYHVDRDATFIERVHARDARRAALKQATRGHDSAWIVDPQLRKMHNYALSTRPLQSQEVTEFTQKHRIASKSSAVKTGYARLDVDVPEWQQWEGSIAQTIARARIE